MQSSFSSPRIFHDHDGWHVAMRASDRQYQNDSKHKFIGEQHLMGPFLSQHLVESWLEGYLDMYARYRHAVSMNPPAFIPDHIHTSH